MFDLPVNNITTEITEELLKPLDSKSRTEFFDFYNSITFIQNLTSVNRKRVKDCPKDSKGRVIVNIVKPHILENMSFFTERADYFKKFGVYTHIPENYSPNSEYKKFWDEEKRRCIEGLVREDGEWITGYHYKYLNYGKIDKVVVIEGSRSERIKDFPDFWDGDYLFFHYLEQAEQEGKHGNILKCRGRGFSFKFADMGDRNYHFIKNSNSFLFASEKEYLIRDGVMSKFVEAMNFTDNNTPFTQPRLKDIDVEKRSGYKDPQTLTDKGFNSNVLAVTCKNEPDKGRGKRGKLLVFDESGIFPGLEKTWKIAQKSVEQGSLVFGLMVSGGTGGTEGADFEAAEKFFSYPKAYNIKALQNVFDCTNGVGECAFFFPEYINRSNCYDINGNSDVVKALVEILLARQHIRNNSSDPRTLIQEKAESCITPQEAVLRTEGSIFPTGDLKDYLAEISPNLMKFVSPHYTGRLAIDMAGKIHLEMSDGRNVIREFPLKDNVNRYGELEVFQMPISLSDGQPAQGRYIAGIDSFDDDSSTTNSLGCIIIYDTWTDNIVAEYTGRPKTANEFYELCRRLLMFYRATANYENDKKGLFAYFSNHNCLYLLCETPSILKDMNMVKGNLYGNKALGTNSSTEINAWGRRLQADWLISPAYGTGGEDEHGNKLPTFMNLQRLRSIGYIKELIGWNIDGNFDRISAMGMCMIYREDRAKYNVKRQKDKVKTLADDEYWSKFGFNSTDNDNMINSFQY